MDDLVRTLIDDEECLEVVAVLLHGAVTVTVTVALGQPLQFGEFGCACGTAETSPSREAKMILECILSKKPRV